MFVIFDVYVHIHIYDEIYVVLIFQCLSLVNNLKVLACYFYTITFIRGHTPYLSTIW